MSVTITQVPDQELAKVWREVEPLLKQAVVTCNRERTQDIYYDLAERKRTLWLAMDAGKIIGTATLKVYVNADLERVLLVDNVAGTQGMSWLYKMFDMFEKYAVSMDCDYIESWALPKWEAMAKRWGMTEIQRVYQKSVGD